ncbi:hypothetical protein CXF86_19195 [Shewanella sp. GutCb]|uniref:nitroreductase family protein n=1 Tax=Shewanella sp. GutCb TaxID=2058315 RepID=UPI000C7C16FB|nr:nitroreductase family protein [Shewanella sp. GutCb]PKG73133.1 hypothetical protein CXF86_19195 [Shewanella sp. GutCb]
MKFKTRIKNKAYAVFFYQTNLGEFVGLIYNYLKYKSYIFNPSKLNVTEKENLEHYLIKQYHIIEKGLSLPDVRLGFGRDKIIALLDASFLYMSKYGNSKLMSAISSTLKEYVEFNDINNHIIDSELKKRIKEFFIATTNDVDGGTKVINKEKLLLDRDSLKCGLITTRHSVRVFSGPITDVNKIKSAVTLGKRAPSVCNRQGWKVHYYNDDKIIQKILSLQNGTTGFTDQINDLIIVTADSKAFTSYEQSQQYIDGGLFSMNLMLALHSESIGVCPLNACFPFVVENKIKKVSNIPDNEKIVMFLALGEMKDDFKVAVSVRKETNEILRIHE